MQELARTQIPAYVAAATPMGLRRAMLLQNAKDRLVHNYYSILYVGGRWYAWYYAEINNDDALMKGGV
jgi:hypothetical protein